MVDLDKWQEIFSSIKRHKLRTFLTALGVFWGIFLLVMLLGVGDGLQRGVKHQFSDNALNSVWIEQGVTSRAYKGLSTGREIRFNNSDYDFLNSNFEAIDNISGEYYLSGNMLLSYEAKQFSTEVRCVHPSHEVLDNLDLINGRFLNNIDVREFRKVAVIGKIIKENTFGDTEAVGKEIALDNIIYKVVGVFEDSGGEIEMRRIYIPISTAQKLNANSADIHRFHISLGDLNLEETQTAIAEIKNAIATRMQFDVTDRKAIRVFNSAEEYQQLQSLYGMLKIFVWFIGGGSIVAGVIGVSNIMLIIVKDRTKEIGIRKALGATPSSIISMILQEAIFITSLAGYLGLIVGVGLISLISFVETPFFRNPQINLGVVIVSVLLLVICGALAGLIPALQAARISPVIAMKAD